jgi:hypothetical protein
MEDMVGANGLGVNGFTPHQAGWIAKLQGAAFWATMDSDCGNKTTQLVLRDYLISPFAAPRLCV